MPIAYRKWFLKRLLKEYEKNKENSSNIDKRQDVNHSNIQKLKKYEDMLSNKT